MKRIKIIKQVPVEPQHGITYGRIFEVHREQDISPKLFVMGDVGIEVGLLMQEYVEIREDENQ